MKNGPQPLFSAFHAQVTSDGNLSLTLPPNIYGNITVRVLLVEDASATTQDPHVDTDTYKSTTADVTVSIWRIPPLLGFEILPYYSALESTGSHYINITDIIGTTAPLFTVTFSNPRVFRLSPTASCSSSDVRTCTLSFELAESSHGTCTISLEMSGQGLGTMGGGKADTKVMVLKVFPLPIILGVSPAVCSHRGGARVMPLTPSLPRFFSPSISHTHTRIHLR
jgi:hypothetical protein